MKCLMISIAFLSYQSILAQVNFWNHSLTDTSKNILYIGVDNYIRVNDEKLKNVELIAQQGKVYKSHTDFNEFLVSSKKVGLDTLRLLIDNNQIIEKVFTVESLGDLHCQLGNISDSIATVDEVLQNFSLNIFIPNSYYKFRATIRTFSIKLEYKNGKSPKTFDENLGDTLTESVLIYIRKLNPGDIINFEDVVVVGPDSCPRTLIPLKIKIV
jgi:hypothetical protein